jgi:hypothetical protein
VESDDALFVYSLVRCFYFYHGNALLLTSTSEISLILMFLREFQLYARNPQHSLKYAKVVATSQPASIPSYSIIIQAD